MRAKAVLYSWTPSTVYMHPRNGVHKWSGRGVVRAPSQQHTSLALQPLSTSTFGPVPNHCTLGTTIVEYVRVDGVRAHDR